MAKIFTGFKIESEILEILKKISKNSKVTITNIITEGINQEINNRKQWINKTDKKKLKEIEREKDRKKILKEIKIRNYQLHTATNLFNNIINTAIKTYKISGQLNMNSIKIMVDDCQKLYKTLQPKVQKAIKPEMKQINTLLLEGQMYIKLRYLKSLNQREKNVSTSRYNELVL